MTDTLEEEVVTIKRTGTLLKECGEITHLTVTHDYGPSYQNRDLAHAAEEAGYNVGEEFEYEIRIPVKKK